MDVKKTYTLGGINYTLRNQGDGFNMFQESAGMELVMEGIAMEYEAFAAYLKAFTPVGPACQTPLSSWLPVYCTVESIS